MTRRDLLLLALVLVELIGAAVLLTHRARRPQPPLPTARATDPLLAQDLASLRANLQNTAADWLQLAEAYAAPGWFPEAEACYRRAAMLAPEDPEITFSWALCSGRLGLLDQSNELLTRTLELGYADESRCWYHLGRNYLRLEQPKLAAEAFLKAKRLPQARHELAKLYLHALRIDEAVPLLNGLMEEFPTSVEPYRLRSLAAALRGQSKTAAEYAELSQWAESPQRLDVADLRAELETLYGSSRLVDEGLKLGGDGQLGQAAELLQQALDAEWRQDVVLPLVNAWMQLGELDRAEGLLKQYVARVGPYPEPLQSLGDICQLRGEMPEAVAYWQRALRMRPSAALHARLARWYQSQDQATLTAQHRAAALHYEGVEAFRRREADRAENALEEALKIRDNLPHTWFHLGETRRLLLRERTSALAAYQRCLELDPHHGRAQAALNRLQGSPSHQPEPIVHNPLVLD